MASSLQYHSLLIFFSFFSLIFVSQSAPPFRPRELILPVHKDGATNLHVADIHKRTPPLPVPFVIDLNGQLLWVDCEQHYLSSTYRAPLCHSTQCSRANSSHICHTCSSNARPGCHNNTCGLVAVNPVTRLSAVGELAQDVLIIQSTVQGSKPGSMVSVPQFLFACAPSFLLQKGLPKNVQGVAGFGHTPIALPTQLGSHFGFQPVFALCLSPSAKNGVIFFGNGPYNLLPGVDVSHPLGFTPLTISPQGEYYIQVSSIKINGKFVPLNTNLLLTGRTMISTTSPYTALESSIFKAFTQFFANELSKVPQVTPVAPFGVCFNSKSLSSTQVGPGVPNIDLVLHTQNVVWRIYGANSMVQARPGVSCLGFVDGGQNPCAPIVMGNYQLEDNLVQFDLARSRLGFSSSLLFRRTACANFNFNGTT